MGHPELKAIAVDACRGSLKRPVMNLDLET